MSAEPTFEHPVIRRLTAADLDSIMRIEEAAYPFPWTRGIFSECLRVGYGCIGVQLGGELAGYAIFNVGAGESHLLNLCIHPGRQRRGLGSLLLEHVITTTRSLGCDAIILEVRPSNPAAAELYRARGFSVIGRRPDYYRAAAGREDALVMRLELRDGGVSA
jgi:ribosomal-protein-alanine N-acetyltransferase